MEKEKLLLEFLNEEGENLMPNLYHYIKDFDIEDEYVKCNYDIDELFNVVEEYIYDVVDVVYYKNAIELLAKEDPSLEKSLELAKEFSYEIDYLNSEILATLLLQNICLNEFREFINEFNTYLYLKENQ